MFQEGAVTFQVFTNNNQAFLGGNQLHSSKRMVGSSIYTYQHLAPGSDNGDLSSIASWRQVLVGIDTGADHPFGAVKLVSTEKGLVVVGEYLERHRSFLEHKASLVRLAG